MAIPSGSIRFNTDSAKMEIYNGDKWWGVDGSPGTESPRMVIGGGYQPAVSSVIQYVQINTTGNTTDFGDLDAARIGMGACASATRGVFAGSGEPNTTDKI